MERFNCTLTKRLFGCQYVVEMRLPEDQRSSEWVLRLPSVVSDLLWTVKLSSWLARSLPKPSKKRPFIPSLWLPTTDVLNHAKNGSPQRRLCYLCQPSELEGGRKRATDPIWSLKLYQIEETITKPNELILYYLHDGPKRGFVPEELLIVPDDTELPSFS